MISSVQENDDRDIVHTLMTTESRTIMSPDPAGLPLQAASAASMMTWILMAMTETLSGVALSGVSASVTDVLLAS
jgi:hypothetical protein